MFRILVVDDNAQDVRLLEILFQSISRPYHLEWAKDGGEALQLLESRKTTPSSLPNVILMDLNMPRVNGLRALEAIKSDRELRLIPVIILSTSALPSDIRNSYQAHASCFVQKPTSVAQYERLIRAIEAFWMDFTHFASQDGHVSPVRGEKGFPLATASGEASRQAISMDESINSAAGLTGSLRCEEHRRLMENFAATVKELLELHQQQFDAAVHGDSECNRFDLLIHMANERKQQAKYAYLRHVEEHGCSNLDVIINTSGT
jgi:chemotaxis family two-component system response regulator Rcp1